MENEATKFMNEASYWAEAYGDLWDAVDQMLEEGEWDIVELDHGGDRTYLSFGDGSFGFVDYRENSGRVLLDVPAHAYDYYDFNESGRT